MRWGLWLWSFKLRQLPQSNPSKESIKIQQQKVWKYKLRTKQSKPFAWASTAVPARTLGSIYSCHCQLWVLLVQPTEVPRSVVSSACFCFRSEVRLAFENQFWLCTIFHRPTSYLIDRGRLVKTIGVYFSPRQVGDANVLKSAKYAHLWQRCGKPSMKFVNWPCWASPHATVLTELRHPELV